MTAKQKNIPALRFSEFQEEWTFKVIGELASIRTGDKDTKDKKGDGLYPFFVRSDNVELIDSYAYDGEAILTSGDGVGVGRNFHYINGRFNYHQRVYCICEFKEVISGTYLFYYFSNSFYKRVIKLSAKNSVDSVRMSMIAEMPIPLPSLPEQQKVASFLTTVDDRIKQLTKKKKLLEQYKKGVIQKLFNQEIRFKDEQGDDYPAWEEKKLSRLNVQIIDGDRGVNYPNGDDFQPSGYCLFLNAKNVTKKGFAFIETMFITEKKDELLGKGKLAKWDLILTTRGSVGNVAFFDNSVHFPQIRINSGMVILRNGNKELYTKYLYKYLSSHLIDKQIISLTFGSAQPQLTVKGINEFLIPFPSLPEQQKIGDFLSSIDEKITFVNTQIEQIQNFKKGLLQQMFV